MRSLSFCGALLLAELLACAVGYGQAPAPTLTLPKAVSGDPAAFIKVSATTNGKIVQWVAVTPGLNVFPAELLRDSLTTVVTGTKSGDYTLLAYTALGDAPSPPALCVVTINGPPIPPPPVVPPTPPPSAELQSIVAPIKLVMATADRAKAATFAAAWFDFATAFKSATERPTQTGTFKASVQAFVIATATKAGLAGAFPGFSLALEQSFVARFGDQDIALDASKAGEWLSAVQWACAGGGQ